MKFGNVRLLTTNFPLILGFWRDVLELTPSYVDESLEYAYFPLDISGIELLSKKSFAQALGATTLPATSGGGQTVIVLAVDQVDTAFSGLLERGAKEISPPKDRPEWGVRSAHLADPEGNLIEIFCKLS